jgi:hypothetical protein
MQKIWYFVLAVLAAWAQLNLDQIPLGSQIGHDGRLAFKLLVGPGKTLFLGTGIVHGSDINIQWNHADFRLAGHSGITSQQSDKGVYRYGRDDGVPVHEDG